MKNILIIILAVTLGILSIKTLLTKDEFPIKQYVCGGGYTDCFVSAKFIDMAVCQHNNEQGNWLCDSMDRNNITCKESEHKIDSYCSDK